MKKSIKLITILLAMLSAFVFISCDQASVEDLFDDGRGDNPDPGPMSGLVAPSWLESKSPSAAGAADGIIYGVTPYMEYSYGRSNIWTQCPGGKIEGLSAGNIFVRYAGTEGRLTGEAALVCMDDVSTYDGTPKLLSAEELADYNVLVVNENTGEVETKKAGSLVNNGQDVYLIESAKAWNTVAANVGATPSYQSAILILGDNLDFSETETDVMMTSDFAGKIYGNGYLIDHFSVTANEECLGLIRKAGEVLYLNYVQMTNSNIEATSERSWFGSLIGSIEDTSETTEVKVIGCFVYGGKVITTGNYVGGLIGESQGNKVILTLNHSKILNSTINGKASTGGLIGRIKNTILTISNCDVVDCWIYSTNNNDGGLLGAFGDGGYGDDVGEANIMSCSVSGCTIRGVGKIGGLFGGAYASYPITATDCHVSNSNLLTTSGGRTGGLIGFTNNANANLLNCDTSDCNLSGSKDVGGLVGTLINSSVLDADGCVVLHSNLKGDTADTTGGIIGSVMSSSTATFKNCHAGIDKSTALYVSSGIPLNGTVNSATAEFISCNYATLVGDAWDLSFPTEAEIAVFPASKLPYVYVTYKTARGSIGAPYSDAKMIVSIPYVRSAPFGSSASGNIPKPLDASADWLMANGKVRNMDPVVPDEVVIADLLN